ncbi:MAG: FkbM family methyltransferase [Amphiplicatus sp.]
MSDEEPFGALAPSPMQARARRLAHRLPHSYFGRKAASLLLGPAGGRQGRAFDVEIFGSQRARLSPADNICEKRVYLTPQHWDPEERTILAGAVAAHRDGLFRFLDIGANAGLYTLFARACAIKRGLHLNAICVEPDPEMRARLAFNVEASGAADDISLLPYAATAADGPLRFAVNVKSRGLSHIDEAGGLVVEGRTIVSMLAESAARRIDALKIDIEGGEYPALKAFFDEAPRALWPRLILCETSHEDPTQSTKALMLAAGYVETLQTQRNFVGTLG